MHPTPLKKVNWVPKVSDDGMYINTIITFLDINHFLVYRILPEVGNVGQSPKRL
jgi:hypothetical protein